MILYILYIHLWLKTTEMKRKARSKSMFSTKTELLSLNPRQVWWNWLIPSQLCSRSTHLLIFQAFVDVYPHSTQSELTTKWQKTDAPPPNNFASVSTQHVLSGRVFWAVDQRFLMLVGRTIPGLMTTLATDGSRNPYYRDLAISQKVFHPSYDRMPTTSVSFTAVSYCQGHGICWNLLSLFMWNQVIIKDKSILFFPLQQEFFTL